MTRTELDKLVTVHELKDFGKQLLVEISRLLAAMNKKEFYSPKEFAKKVGRPYTTIIDHLNKGKLKGRQNEPGGAWEIPATELVRFGIESEENFFEV